MVNAAAAGQDDFDMELTRHSEARGGVRQFVMRVAEWLVFPRTGEYHAGTIT